MQRHLFELVRELAEEIVSTTTNENYFELAEAVAEARE